MSEIVLPEIPRSDANDQKEGSSEKHSMSLFGYYDYIKMKRGYELGVLLLFLCNLVALPLWYSAEPKSVANDAALVELVGYNITARSEMSQWSYMTCSDITGPKLFVSKVGSISKWIYEFNAPDNIEVPLHLSSSDQTYLSIITVVLPSIILYSYKEIATYMRAYGSLGVHISASPCKLQKEKASYSKMLIFYFYILLGPIIIYLSLTHPSRIITIDCTVTIGSNKPAEVLIGILLCCLGIAWLCLVYLYTKIDPWKDLLNLTNMHSRMEELNW